MIGIDGSGKSTVNARVRAWLGSDIDVMPIYFGTGAGRASLVLRPFKLMVPLLTRLLKSKPRGSSHGKISKEAPGLLYSLLLMVWAAVVAHEKRGKLQLPAGALVAGWSLSLTVIRRTKLAGSMTDL